MIIFLALVLIILMILIGGERGAVSLMTLAGNIVILFISILLMSIGFLAREKGRYALFEGSDWQTGAYFEKRPSNFPMIACVSNPR